ncbi:MAG: ABC transporter ATP-binding protein [Bacteroidales bacterium]|nr:ABC transporter ATP-binding protein [Bacteroidales bacterium]
MRDFFKLVFSYLRPYKKYALLNVLFNMAGIVFSLFSLAMLAPFLGILFKTQPLVTSKVAFELSQSAILNNLYYYLSQVVIAYGERSALLVVSGGVVSMILLKNASVYFANYFMAPLRNGVVRDIRNTIYSKTLQLPIGYFTQSRKGDIISRMSGDVQEVEWSVMSSLEMAFRDPATILIFVISLFIMSPTLTLFVLLLLPLSGLIIGKIGKTLRKTSLKGQAKMGELMSIIEETLSGLRIIKAFNAEKRIKHKFEQQNNEYTRISNKIMRKRYLASPLSEFLGVAVMIGMMWYGGIMVLEEESSLSPQGFIIYLAIFSQVINPAKSFSQAFYNIQKGMASMDRVNAVLQAEDKIVDSVDAIRINRFNHQIKFNNVNFRYETEPVLTNINLTVDKGKTIALVGQSGSGKSTLVDLIPRFYDIDNGTIEFDGIPVKNIRISDLRNLMGIVNQESILFNDSFFNNIAFGVDSATEEEVIAAAKVANAHDFIMETPEGYYTNIGDRGGKLSGGQRQRISIARAVLKNPPILILDEATSALDTESERLVQDALTNLMKNRTSIVIAHRLSTIKHADLICVLHEGRIVECGEHESLIKKNGTYRKLHDLQMF